ncbi:Uncharacterised protein [Mycobacteroides abscessus subsp. abscessus]|nr:Uncharacterised protein [Mycobacteroides abscessus subsp. abscessus]
MHDEAREHVGDGQEEEQAGLGGVDDVAEHLASTLRGSHEVRVREGHALGVSGGSGGVDDGGDVRGRDGRASLLDVLNGDAGGGACDHALGAAIEGVDRHGVFGSHGVHELGLLGGGREDAGYARVGEDVLDLGGGVGLVDRDGDRADGQEREVEEEPLVRGRGQDCDSVSRLHAEADEAAGCVLDLALELRCGERTRGADGRALLDRHLVGV